MNKNQLIEKYKGLNPYLKGVGLLSALIVFYLLFFRGSGVSEVSFRTTKITKGDINVSITASGTVEPEEVIDIGAQVAGQILFFGKDVNGQTIDYGSVVEEGSVLAQIDDSIYQTEATQAEAELKRSKANVQLSSAKLLLAEKDWKRAQLLGPSDALSKSAYDTYIAEYKTAQANLAVSEAMVTQAEAALSRAKRNLGFCVIKSPVRGVIVDRRVNIGQTVVSSLNAPSLFLLAKDLKKMEVWVSVNEADIGFIKQGQQAIFTVDALPGEQFVGEVKKIRLNASMTQNVVTYIVEVSADNTKEKLLPYLTANVVFKVSNKKDSLLVQNAALRWVPKPDQILMIKEEKDSIANSTIETGYTEGKLWVLKKNKVSPIHVLIGGSDGINTEIKGGDIFEGMEIVVGERTSKSETQHKTANSPFAPSINRGKK